MNGPIKNLNIETAGPKKPGRCRGNRRGALMTEVGERKSVL
jgi:hypothetical protein